MAKLKQAVIFGQGGHARVIASMIAEKFGPVVYVTTGGEKGSLTEERFFADAGAYRDSAIFLGIGDNAVREKVFGKLKAQGLNVTSCISPAAFVAKDAVLGEGVTVCPGAVIMTGAKVGNNVIVNTMASLDHDCVVGDHAHVAVGVSLCGGVKIGAGSMLGVKTAVVPNVTIGERCFLKAGAVVVGDLPAGTTAAGVPAKPCS